MYSCRRCITSLSQPLPIFQQIRGIKKSPTYVILNEAIDGLGRTGDVVAVDRSLARSKLVPTKKATYVKRDALGKPIFPDEFVAKASKWTGVADNLLHQGTSPLSDTVLMDLLDQLQSVSVIKITRSPTPHGDNTFFGSVTSHDVGKLLQDEFKIAVDPHMIHIGKGDAEEKIKHFGEHSCQVNLPRAVPVSMILSVHPSS